MSGDRSRDMSDVKDAAALQEARSLDRKSWRNWFLFVGVAIITTIGLATAILTLLGGRIETLWPWANTDLILLAGLSVAILLFAGYLTQQQRQVVALRLQLIHANQLSSEKVRQYYDRLAALVNVSRVLATSTDPQAVFDSITTTCLETFDCQQTSLMLLNDQTQELEVRSVKGTTRCPGSWRPRRRSGRGSSAGSPRGGGRFFWAATWATRPRIAPFRRKPRFRRPRWSFPFRSAANWWACSA